MDDALVWSGRWENPGGPWSYVILLSIEAIYDRALIEDPLLIVQVRPWTSSKMDGQSAAVLKMQIHGPNQPKGAGEHQIQNRASIIYPICCNEYSSFESFSSHLTSVTTSSCDSPLRVSPRVLKISDDGGWARSLWNRVSQQYITCKVVARLSVLTSCAMHPDSFILYASVRLYSVTLHQRHITLKLHCNERSGLSTAEKKNTLTIQDVR